MPKSKTTKKDTKKLAPKRQDPYCESQLSAADIRDILKEELASFRASIVEEVLERMSGAQAPAAAEAAQAQQDPYSLEAPMPSVEKEAYGPVLSDYHLRKEVGMSNDLAEVLSKLNNGMDLTPLQFNFPPKESHFKAVEGFQTYFVEQVKSGKTQHGAYIDTCEHFGLRTFEKADPRRRILAELPAEAGGAFRLSAGEAAKQLGLPLLDAPKEEP